MNILIVEDEVIVAQAIRNIIRTVPVVNVIDVAHDFQTALEKGLSDVFDLMVIDIGLGDQSVDGLDLVAKIRERKPAIPLLISTSFHSYSYLERAFALGVTDYLRKPFHPKELTARIQRWLGLHNLMLYKSDLSYEGLYYDPQRHEVFCRGKKLPLSKRNKDLMLLFLRDPETLLRRRYLCEKYWGDYTDHPRNLRSSIQDLRKCLGEPYDSWVKTVRGEGYILQRKAH